MQFQGTTGTAGEVELAHRALRTTLRPTEYGTNGIYKKGLFSGVMAAGLAAAAPIVSFRYGGAKMCLIRRVLFSAGSITALTAGVTLFNLFAARAFTASDSTGTGATLTGNNGKLRTSMATTGVADFRCSSTAALTVGTRTKDTDPAGTATSSVANVAGAIILPPTEILRCQAGEEPLELVTNEGFVIEGTVPAVGTWGFSVSVDWDEVELAAWGA